MDSRPSATTSAITSPMTKLMMVRGMVTVIAALANGHRLSATSFHTERCPASAPPGVGAPVALAFRYFCEIAARVPSAFRSSRALFSSGSRPLFLRAAKACSLFCPIVAPILTDWSLVSDW